MADAVNISPQPPRTKTKKIIQLILKLAVSAAALAYVVYKVDFDKIGHILLQSNYLFFGGALLFFILSKLISALRLNRYFAAIGVDLPAKANIRLYLLGMFYNIFLPGGIGGDGYKVFWLGKRFNVRKRMVLGAVFLDRINGVYALCCLAIVLYYLIEFPWPFLRYFVWLLIPLGTLLFYVFHLKFFKSFKKIVWSSMAYSFGVQVAQLIAAFFIFQGLADNGDLLNYLFVFLVSSVVSIIPITVGGAGLRELTFFWGAQLLALHLETAVALSLIFYLITLVVSFSGIFYSIKTDKILSYKEGT